MDWKIKALADHLGVEKTAVKAVRYDKNTFCTLEGNYLVCTELEAEKLLEQALDSYLEDYFHDPEDAPALRPYFEEVEWRRHAKLRGRGHWLASFDGDERTHWTSKGATFIMIYRIS